MRFLCTSLLPYSQPESDNLIVRTSQSPAPDVKRTRHNNNPFISSFRHNVTQNSTNTHIWRRQYPCIQILYQVATVQWFVFYHVRARFRPCLFVTLSCCTTLPTTHNHFFLVATNRQCPLQIPASSMRESFLQHDAPHH